MCACVIFCVCVCVRYRVRVRVRVCGWGYMSKESKAMHTNRHSEPARHRHAPAQAGCRPCLPDSAAGHVHRGQIIRCDMMMQNDECRGDLECSPLSACDPFCFGRSPDADAACTPTRRPPEMSSLFGGNQSMHALQVGGGNSSAHALQVDGLRASGASSVSTRCRRPDFTCIFSCHPFSSVSYVDYARNSSARG